MLKLSYQFQTFDSDFCNSLKMSDIPPALLLIHEKMFKNEKQTKLPICFGMW